MINLAKLNKYKNDGWLKSQKHPRLPLIIWNYTKQTQYEGKWDEITTLCRGLVTDNDGNIVAHPFRKFFNYGELKAWNKVPTGSYRAFEKLDGSIIQVFNYEGEWVISSKGSFTSDQAHYALDMFNPENNPSQSKHLDPKYNYIFELIHPENRIVLDYGPIEDLVLLGMVAKDGSEAHISHIDFFSTSPLAFSNNGLDEDTDWEAIRQEIPNNKEGYVIVFDSGERMKLKSDEYCRLHRIVTQTTYRDIWTALRDEHDLRDFIERMPDEWINWFHQKIGELYVKYNLILDQVKRDLHFGQEQGLYSSSANGEVYYTYESRRKIAEYINTCMYPSLMFDKIDGRPIRERIWDMIRPEHEKAFMI